MWSLLSPSSWSLSNLNISEYPYWMSIRLSYVWNICCYHCICYCFIARTSLLVCMNLTQRSMEYRVATGVNWHRQIVVDSKAHNPSIHSNNLLTNSWMFWFEAAKMNALIEVHESKSAFALRCWGLRLWDVFIQCKESSFWVMSSDFGAMSYDIWSSAMIFRLEKTFSLGNSMFPKRIFGFMKIPMILLRYQVRVFYIQTHSNRECNWACHFKGNLTWHFNSTVRTTAILSERFCAIFPPSSRNKSSHHFHYIVVPAMK